MYRHIIRNHQDNDKSSNDVCPSAMHMVVVTLTHNKLLQALSCLYGEIENKQTLFTSSLTVARTDL